MTMKKVDYLIVGGGVAGTIAAEFIRMNDSEGSIAIVTEEPDHLYSRVLLPHYLRGKIDFDRLFVRRPEEYEEKKIELFTNRKVSSINTNNKTVSSVDGHEIQYKKLLIASGGKVNRLKTPGSNLNGVTYLRTKADAKKIKNLIGNVKNAAVVGGGFIGIEFAQSFVEAGLKTTAIVREPYFWSLVVGKKSGMLIDKILEKNGVEVITNSEVDKFIGRGTLNTMKLNTGKIVSAEIAGIGIGIHMNLDYLKGSGLKIDKGVFTNEYLETETRDVWAAGDIAQFNDVVLNKRHQLGNWSNAAAQGKSVGENMAAGWGSSSRQQFETVSAYTISIFDASFTLLGDPSVDSDTEIIERGSVDEGKLGRLHIRGDKIMGASLINLPADRSSVSNLIKIGKKITAKKNKLSDSKFDLKSLLE